MYNLLEYSENYSMISGSLRNLYRDEINDDINENNRFRNRLNNNKTIRSESFEYMIKLIWRTTDNDNIINAEATVPWKYLRDFWRSLDLPLINCDIEFELKWPTNFVIAEVSKTFRAVDPNVDPVEYKLVTATTGARFQLNNAKLYAPVVTFSINDNIKFLENINQGIKRAIKYRPKIIKQPKSNNLSD